MDWKGASEAAAGATASGTSTTTTTSTLTSSSTTTVTGTSLIGLGVVRTAQDKIYHHQHNNHHQQHKEPTDLSNPTTSQVLSHKRNKPIPPPLDLSIGAANLSLNNHIHLQHHPNSHHHNHHLHHNHHHPQHLSTNSNSANHNLHNNHQSQSSSSQQQQPPTPTNQNHQPYQHHQQPNVGSPKFTQSDKNLPLRKRWHSWSPTPMNGQDESMVPLFPDTHVSSNKGAGVNDTPQSPVNHQPPPPYHQPYSSPGPVSSYTRTSSQSSSGGAGGNHYGMQSNGLSMGSTPPPPNIIMSSSAISMNNHHNNIVTTIHTVTTPTPFYTPNEPSPKFMNSPVFSYSNPDTSLYQGPFSPMRASSLYPPPSSPFTNLNLNSPLAPLQTNSSSISTSNSGGGMGSVGNSVCFNMIPSTLLSPAPSQASTNSLSYEDLHEKSLSFLTPAWSVFLPGTKVRFVTAMNSMDWYLVDFLAQSAESLIGLKGEYAPHGLEVRKFVVTSSAKERIQVTFCPVSDPHPPIEVNCEPGHPFMVDKKGWCAIKPDVFLETYGTPCQQLECGDVCMSLGAARSPNQYAHHQQQHHQHNSQVFPLTSAANHNGFMNHITNGGGGNGIGIKIEHESEKSVPISVVPQTQMHNNHSSMMPIQSSTSILNRKLNSIPISAPASPAKKSKDSNNCPAPGETKGRRPMNAFLLFAKDKRPELIQLYPGKDNRSISVLLGEAWQTLNPVDKDRYAESAKRNAEEQKRMHPDCWKRKRSQSTSS